MRILYVSSFNTTACRTGAECRSFWLRRALERLGEVTVVERTSNGMLARRMTVLNAWTVLLRKVCPLMTFPYYRDDFARRFVRDGKYDAVVVRYLSEAAYLGAWSFGIPCYVDIDDLPEQLCASKWRRALVRVWQRWACRRTAGCWVANREHANVIGRYTRCVALPNIANGPKEVSEAPGGAQVFLSVGSLRHPPNVEGIARFIASDWPRIRAEFPAAEYRIAGGGCPEETAACWSRVPGVKLLGFVDDLAPVYAAASAVVCPIYSGSGTCIKAVEALMHGRIVIGSPFAFRGWTDEQKAQSFVKVGEDGLSSVCCTHLQVGDKAYEAVSPHRIRAWADVQFGEKVFDAAVRDLVR